MAPSSLDKLKKQKSKDSMSAKLAEPMPTSPGAEPSNADSKKRKRRSQAGADATPRASNDAQPVESESASRKSRKTKKEAATPTESVQAHTAEKAAAKKSKDKQQKEHKEVVDFAPVKGKGKGKKTDAVDQSAAAEEQAKDVEMIAGAEKKAKSKKGRKSAKEAEHPAQGALIEATGKQEGVEATEAATAKDEQPKPSKKAHKESSATSHKAPSPEPEPSASDDDEAPLVEKDAEVDGEADHLYGFSTDDDDSSDEEMGEEWGGIDVSKLPTVAKDDAVVKKKLEKAKRHPTEDRGVIYLGRIPHGFYEDQMRQYLSQFGPVTRLRLSRNKKTGRSKHYAFIEFDSSSVAQIVAETMDNYLLMGHILTCKIIPKDEVHPELWIGANRKWRVVPRSRIARVQHNKPRTPEEQERAEKRLLKRQAQRKRKLEEAGINYDFSAVAYKKSKPVEA
ncbi:uncharacterized protein C8Q71DRAFT_522698 [Rhodofomes roseus]|uniref:RRM domain-containing protein n=1 Tax=Rhodofomes roseus TaxID=34475 RepID=A0ABQ8KKT0_9APHY|nr:uncharacterized protein C8Q71DRAFT_522698 [Rhodofomes roseus]KAH9838315.1 hypothetical protein C8Q71DRAFT_522698 [Rhodofomes roseus]